MGVQERINNLTTVGTYSGTMGAQKMRKLEQPRKDILDDIDVVCFDCDGVIWHGENLVPEVPAVLKRLQDLGKKYYFVTNNSTQSRAMYVKKFERLLAGNAYGITVKKEEIVPTSLAAAIYLKSLGFGPQNPDWKVYVIGEKGILDELDEFGIPHVGGEEHNNCVPDMTKGKRFEVDQDIKACVVGYDRQINFYKINYAQTCINELKAKFIATNLDATTHATTPDQEWAGGGCMVACIQHCCHRHPYTLVGKPAAVMVDYVADQVGIKDRSRMLMVGDRLDTDMAFGLQHGMRTLLTLGGCTPENELHAAEKDKRPEFYVDSVADFLLDSNSVSQ